MTTGNPNASTEPDEFGPYCPEIGQDHAWGEWEWSEVGTHEVRFCSSCGSMETQELVETTSWTATRVSCDRQGCGWQAVWPTHDDARSDAIWHAFEEHQDLWVERYGKRRPAFPRPVRDA